MFPSLERAVSNNDRPQPRAKTVSDTRGYDRFYTTLVMTQETKVVTVLTGDLSEDTVLE